MQQCEIDSARRMYEGERGGLDALADDPAVIDTAAERVGLRLACDSSVEADPVMADALLRAKPGCEVELMGLCGALLKDAGRSLPLDE